MKLSKRKIIPNSCGDVLHILKSTDPEYQGFGEVYISWINPNTVKAWKLHKEFLTNLVVPFGEVSFIIKASDTPESQSDRVTLGHNNYQLLTIPSNVWYGFKCVSSIPAMIVSCSTGVHDPLESLREEADATQFNVNWDEI